MSPIRSRSERASFGKAGYGAAFGSQPRKGQHLPDFRRRRCFDRYRLLFLIVSEVGVVFDSIGRIRLNGNPDGSAYDISNKIGWLNTLPMIVFASVHYALSIPYAFVCGHFYLL